MAELREYRVTAIASSAAKPTVYIKTWHDQLVSSFYDLQISFLLTTLKISQQATLLYVTKLVYG